MNLPSGLIFFMDFKYGTAKSGKATTDSLYGGTGAKFGRTDAASGGLYGEGQYGYSLPGTSSASSVAATFTTASWADFGFDNSLSASIAATPNVFKKITIAASALTNVDVEAVKLISVTDTNVNQLYPAFAKHDYAGDNIILFASGAHDTTLTTVKFQEQPVAYDRGDFEDRNPITGGPDGGTNLNIPEVDLELKSESIVAKTRKLKATKNGKDVEFAKRTRIMCDKNHVTGVTTKGTTVITVHGFIDDDPKAIDQYKKEHKDEWLTILGAGDFEIKEDLSEWDESRNGILAVNDGE